jgi:hypothetical protein
VPVATREQASDARKTYAAAPASVFRLHCNLRPTLEKSLNTLIRILVVVGFGFLIGR